MGKDARIRYSQMMIKQNFIELLKHQPVNRITVKKICELAEINRATFYKYYEDPFDLLEKMEQELMEELQQYVGLQEDKDIRKTLLQILEKIKDNSGLYMTLTSENGDSRFPARILSICYEQMAADLRQQYPGLSDAQCEWLYCYLAHGCSAVLTCWIKNGMEESAEEVSGFIEKLLRNSTQNLSPAGHPHHGAS